MQKWHTDPCLLFSTMPPRASYDSVCLALHLVEGGDIYALHVILDVLNLLRQPVHRHFVIFHNARNLQLVNSEGERHEFSCEKRKNIYTYGLSHIRTKSTRYIYIKEETYMHPKLDRRSLSSALHSPFLSCQFHRPRVSRPGWCSI